MYSKLSKNIIYQMTYQGLAIFYPLLTTPLISKAFGTEVLGIYSYTYSIVFYFSLCASLGIHTYGSRLISINRNKKSILSIHFWELYAVQFLCSMLVIIIYFIYIFQIETRFFKFSFLQGITILVAMIDISWFLTGLEQFKGMVLRNCVIKILSLILIFVFIHTKEDLGKYILIVSGTNLLGQASVWSIALRHVERPHIKIINLRKHIWPVLKLFIPVIAINSYVLIDKVMLGIARSMQEVGYYENSEKLIKMPIGLASAVCAVMLPRAAYYISQGKISENNKSVFNTLKYSYIAIIPAIVGLGCIAPELVPWYLGNDFLPCILFIQVLVPIIFPMVISNVLRFQYFVALHKDREYTYSIIGAVLINLIINVMLVKAFGIYGVIAGSMISEIYAMLYLIIKTKDDIFFIRLLPLCLKCAIAAGIMGAGIRAVGMYFGTGIVTNLIQIIMGTGIYFAVLYILTGRGKEINYFEKN